MPPSHYLNPSHLSLLPRPPQFDINLRIFNLFLMVLKLLFVAHIQGCFWYGTAAASAEGESELSDGAATWVSSYGGDETTTLAERYLWSLYWALTTLTTVGYGDITPANNLERVYTCFALILGALIMAGMISELSALMVSLDHQATLVQEKLDAVKEYAASRKLPKPLAMRLKKHFKYYYSQRPAFDELELLSECPPALRASIQREILSGTLGRLSLFSHHLDPDFQLEIFPFIKPVSYASGDVIFSKGEISRDLLFLLEGEVDVMSVRDENAVETRLTPSEEIYVAANEKGAPGEPTLSVAHYGCFGEDVLAGYRRTATHIARTWVETLSLSRTALLTIFEQNPRAARKLVALVLHEFRKKERLASISVKLMLGLTRKGSDSWAALTMQRVWGRWRKGFLAKPVIPDIDDTQADVDARAAANGGILAAAPSGAASPAEQGSPHGSHSGVRASPYSAEGKASMRPPSQSPRRRERNDEAPTRSPPPPSALAAMPRPTLRSQGSYSNLPELPELPEEATEAITQALRAAEARVMSRMMSTLTIAVRTEFDALRGSLGIEAERRVGLAGGERGTGLQE